jgi:hypothetical protein
MNAAPEILPVFESTEWSAAAERVTRYLRAHRLASPGQIARLTADIIAIARTRSRPGAEPVALAMETLDSCLHAWFAQLLPAGERTDAPLLARGRVALAMGEVPERWPSYFLGGHGVPVELQRVMREADLGRAPEIKFSNMAPRPLLAPATAGSRFRWALSYRWPFLRIVTGLMVVLSLLGATWAAGR